MKQKGLIMFGADSVNNLGFNLHIVSAERFWRKQNSSYIKR
ncbi:MAG: hypothetical protein P9L96_04775 [Candidatus Gygaella obscura]|nr:hypothetical protein [Candidatus Gygaella obscura]